MPYMDIQRVKWHSKLPLCPSRADGAHLRQRASRAPSYILAHVLYSATQSDTQTKLNITQLTIIYIYT